jgi:hypothetical protein
MYLFRGGAPVREFAAAQRPVLSLGIRLVGKRFLKEYPYEPLYFLPYARQFRAALKMPIVLLGGVTDRTGMDTAMAEGFDFVAMARALLREPDLPQPHQGRCVDRVPVHPLQPVHADDLLRHPLPADQLTRRRVRSHITSSGVHVPIALRYRDSGTLLKAWPLALLEDRPFRPRSDGEPLGHIEPTTGPGG